MTTQDRAVLFIDLLGFGNLTEQNALDFDAIRRRQNVLSWFDDIFEKPRNPLTHTFTEFHYTMKWAIELAQMRHPLTAITFSDSAFIATTHLSDCINIAIHIQTSLLRRHVPARAGIAFGSFSTIRFKSDVIGEWGDHSAHFLGTGVIRSNAAEGCGIKGLRILLHPSVAALLNGPTKETSDAQEINSIPCSTDEAANAVGVLNEIDYWRYRHTAEAEAWRAFQDMWTAAPHGELAHYEATAHAINRMRVSQGEEPLGNLRRRTLPRRSKKLAL